MSATAWELLHRITTGLFLTSPLCVGCKCASVQTVTCTLNRLLICFDYHYFPRVPVQGLELNRWFVICTRYAPVCVIALVCCTVLNWTVTLRAGWRSMLPQERSRPKTSWTERPRRPSISLSLRLKRVRWESLLKRVLNFFFLINQYILGFFHTKLLGLELFTSDINNFFIEYKADKCNTFLYSYFWFPPKAHPEKSSEHVLSVRVLDVNDNVPRLTENQAFICVKKLEPILVRASDADSAPYSQPFTFSLEKDKRHIHWKLAPVDGTDADALWSCSRVKWTSAT